MDMLDMIRTVVLLLQYLLKQKANTFSVDLRRGT